MVVRRIAPAESDLAIAEGDQAVVGDSYAMGVTAEIVHDIFRATEGAFQIDHPILSMKGSQPSGEDLGLCQKLQVSVEVENWEESRNSQSHEYFAKASFACTVSNLRP